MAILAHPPPPLPSTLPPSSLTLLRLDLHVPTLLLCLYPFHSHFLNGTPCISMSLQYTLYLHVPSVHPVSACPFSTPCISMSLQYTLYLHVPSVHPVSPCPSSTPCISMSLHAAVTLNTTPHLTSHSTYNLQLLSTTQTCPLNSFHISLFLMLYNSLHPLTLLQSSFVPPFGAQLSPKRAYDVSAVAVRHSTWKASG